MGEHTGIVRLGTWIARLSAGGVIVLGFVLLAVPVRSFLSSGDLPMGAMWLVMAAAFLAYGGLAMASLTGLLPAAYGGLVRPVVKLGAILMALAGPAWMLVATFIGSTTGDWAYYAYVFGAVMFAHGVATFWALEQTDGMRAGAAGA